MRSEAVGQAAMVGIIATCGASNTPPASLRDIGSAGHGVPVGRRGHRQVVRAQQVSAAVTALANDAKAQGPVARRRRREEASAVLLLNVRILLLNVKFFWLR